MPILRRFRRPPTVAELHRLAAASEQASAYDVAAAAAVLVAGVASGDIDAQAAVLLAEDMRPADYRALALALARYATEWAARAHDGDYAATVEAVQVAAATTVRIATG